MKKFEDVLSIIHGCFFNSRIYSNYYVTLIF